MITDEQLKREFEDSLGFLKYKFKNNREQLNKINLLESRYKKGLVSIDEIRRYRKMGEDNC